MPVDGRPDNGSRLRVWIPGVEGIVLRFQQGRLRSVESDVNSDHAICDPAILESLLTPEARLLQHDLAQFILRAFGPESPLIRSPDFFRLSLLDRIEGYGHVRELLDIGCGHPRHLSDWISITDHVSGLDILPEGTSPSVFRYRSLTPEGLIPFSEGEFDLVVGLFVLEHVLDIQKFLAEVYRVLTPDGIALFVTTHCSTDADQHAGLSFGHFRDYSSSPAPGHRWIVSLDNFLKNCWNLGFEVIHTQGTVLTPGSRELEWCELMSGKVSRAEHMWVDLRKKGDS